MNNKFRPPESFLENTKQTLVLVDYSNLLYRAWFVSSKRAGIAYCKFFDMLRLCVKRSKQKDVPLRVVFAGESKVQLDRAKIFKEYKGTRVTINDPQFRKFRIGLAELLKFIGWDIIDVDGAEADDVIASIVAKYCYREDKATADFLKVIHINMPIDTRAFDTDIVIFSGDRDLQQCLAWDRVFVYRAPGMFVTRDSCEAEYGIPIDKYSVYKALTGDRSDNIKGVEGFGPAKASVAVSAQSVAHDIWEMSGEKGAREFRLAMDLVQLDTKLDINLENLYLGSPLFEEGPFLKTYDQRLLLEVQRLKEEF